MHYCDFVIEIIDKVFRYNVIPYEIITHKAISKRK